MVSNAANLATISESSDLVNEKKEFHTCGRINQYKWDRSPKYRYRLLVQQPSQNTLRLLFGMVTNKTCINRVDVALDLTTQNQRDADELKDFFYLHLMQRWRGKRSLEMAKHEPGLDDHDKVNYLRAIKRVIGMQPLPMPS